MQSSERISLNAFCLDSPCQDKTNGLREIYSAYKPSSFWFGADECQDVKVISTLVPYKYHNWSVYILKWDAGYFKIGRAACLETRLYGYMGDIRHHRTFYNSRNFQVMYVIDTNNQDRTEHALKLICNPYKIKGEYFRKLDNSLVRMLEALSSRKVCV